jgi:probable rRNA maturation factor
MSDALVSLLITDDRGIKTLNRDFRNVDKATNVLAFPAREAGSPEEFEKIFRAAKEGGAAESPKDPGAFPPLPGKFKYFIGDIAVSFETVTREAAESGAETGELFYFYLLHGLLHLMGHDHERGDEAEKAQDEALRKLMGLIRTDL